LLKKPADNVPSIEMPRNYIRMSYNPLRTIALTLIVGVFGILSTFSVPQRAHADTTTIIPPRFDLFGNPGDTVKEKLKVRNDSTTPSTYSVQVDNFTAQGEEGGVALLDTADGNNTTYALAQWITTEPTNFSLAAGEERVVDITVKIPASGEPGGHYASVLVNRGGATAAGGSVSVASRVGSLVLLRVSGAVTEKAHVSTFAAEESFAQYSPVNFDLRTVNDGNVHIAPKGTIVITNMFGKKVKEIPLTNANVLPGATRLVKTTWDDKGLIGRYTATLVATYGQQNQTLTASTSFIVFPLYLLWIILAVFAVILLAVTQRKAVKRIINRLTSD
jgi:hypothetical protein